MLTTILLFFLLGITWGILLLTISLPRLFKVNCPQCKQLKPLQEIFVFKGWKTRIITGQACQQCQKPKPQIEIML